MNQKLYIEDDNRCEYYDDLIFKELIYIAGVLLDYDVQSHLYSIFIEYIYMALSSAWTNMIL